MPPSRGRAVPVGSRDGWCEPARGRADGHGQDGLIGAELVVGAGGSVLAQDEQTSVVWGMPGFVARAGLARAVLPLDDIPQAIVAAAQSPVRSTVGTR